MWISDVSVSYVPLLTQPSELVAHTNARVEVVGLVAANQSAANYNGSSVARRICLQEAVSQTALHLRPHHTCEQVDVLRKAPIDDQGDRIQRSAAARRAGIGASTRRIGAGGKRTVDEAVLPFVVIGARDIESWRDRISRADPGRLQHPVGGEVGVVGCTEDVSALEEGTGIQRVIRVAELDMLIATKQLPLPDGVFGTNLEVGVVGDGAGYKPLSGAHTSGVEPRKLRSTQDG